jgi:hypothetical protein
LKPSRTRLGRIRPTWITHFLISFFSVSFRLEGGPVLACSNLLTRFFFFVLLFRNVIDEAGIKVEILKNHGEENLKPGTIINQHVHKVQILTLVSALQRSQGRFSA